MGMYSYRGGDRFNYRVVGSTIGYISNNTGLLVKTSLTCHALQGRAKAGSGGGGQLKFGA